MKPFFRFCISLALPLLVGGISSYYTMDAITTWYAFLEKPFFNPPNWIFGPVWTVLYILMGISFFLIWNRRGNIDFSKAYIWYFVQLFLNGAWSFVFFYFQNPSLALANIVLLLGAVGCTMYYFYQIRKASALLLIPYLLWISFASILNLSIVLLN